LAPRIQAPTNQAIAYREDNRFIGLRINLVQHRLVETTAPKSM
jgi:hypothetical protein